MLEASLESYALFLQHLQSETSWSTNLPLFAPISSRCYDKRLCA